MVTGIVGSTMASNGNGVTVTALKDLPAKSDRRSNKPIMEKRRRARINNCLNELKTLILDATKKDPARHSKLEKADILEKTVKHLQELQRQQSAMQQAADPKIINKFKAGFTDCANEVSRFPGLEPAVKRRLLQHLSNCINGVKTELMHQPRQMVAVEQAQLHAQVLPSPPCSPKQFAVTTASSCLQAAQSANGYCLPNGIQVIPTKLPNGSIALVLPQHLPQHAQRAVSMSLSPQGSILLPIPSRTASTGSASSHSSSSYDRALSSPSNSMHYAPPSPTSSYEAMDCNLSVIQHAPGMVYQQTQPQSQQPLSLVIKKDIKVEDQPWRPW